MQSITKTCKEVLRSFTPCSRREIENCESTNRLGFNLQYHAQHLCYTCTCPNTPSARGKFRPSKGRAEKVSEEGIIGPVTLPTDWLSNMLVKEKPNGKLWICIDPSQTINKAIKRPKYTIPTIEEKLPLLTRAKVFTIVDGSGASHTIVLDEKSSLPTTFQGPNGRYCYNRMPFGIASGLEEYQRRQHEFLDGLRSVINIADDICVYGCGDSKEDADIDHDRNLVQLLEKCAEHDLRYSAKKLQFKSPSVTFMGHKLTHKGVEPNPAKVAAIREMPVPTDKVAVQRFLRMCQYLSKFYHNLS